MPFYHLVSDQPEPHVHHLLSVRDRSRFREDLDFLLARYAPVDIGQVINAHRSGEPFQRPSVLITVDDGLRHCSDVIAPILREKGVPAVFFLTTSFLDNRQLFYRHKASLLVDRLRNGPGPSRATLDRIAGLLRAAGGATVVDIQRAILSVPYRLASVLDDVAEDVGVDFQNFLRDSRPYLSGDEVKALIADGFAVGGHSLDHPLFGAIQPSDQVGQAIGSVVELSNRFETEHQVFAFPFNDEGVSMEFFDQVASRISLCFGTAGMRPDRAVANLHRIWMEESTASARRVFARAWTKSVVRSALGRNRVERPLRG